MEIGNAKLISNVNLMFNVACGTLECNLFLSRAWNIEFSCHVTFRTCMWAMHLASGQRLKTRTYSIMVNLHYIVAREILTGEAHSRVKNIEAYVGEWRCIQPRFSSVNGAHEKMVETNCQCHLRRHEYSCQIHVRDMAHFQR